MDITELLEYLDIEEPEEFEYFEHLADLLELEQQISHEACYSLFSAVPEATMTELVANYFEDIMENLPDDTIDIYTLLTTIRQSLLGLARNIGTPDGTRAFVDEFLKFKNWYSLDSCVHCKRISDGLFSDATACEALALCRLEKLNEAEYDYDFSDCLDYEVDEYTVNLSDVLDDDFDENQERRSSYSHSHSHGRHSHDCDCGCDHDEDEDDEDGVDAYRDGLVDLDNPVIDGEYEEDDN